MSAPPSWPSRVVDAEILSPGLKRFVLERDGGAAFPAASPGAHVVVTLHGGERRWKNAYSLVSPPEAPRYEIIVRRTSPSRGGSTFMHERLAPGDAIDVAGPVNLFPIYRRARRHLLISAGVGITPFLSFLPVLRRDGLDFSLHHLGRAEDAAAIEALLAQHAGSDIVLHPARTALDLAAVLAAEGLQTHLYVCGPQSFMDAVMAAARDAGWPDAKLHQEKFGAASGGAPFVATLARSGTRIEVGAEQTLLEAIEAAGIAAPSLCRGGACGQCQVPVLAGVPDHRDHVLDEDARARGDTMMTCVSRSLGDTIVLDL